MLRDWRTWAIVGSAALWTIVTVAYCGPAWRPDVPDDEGANAAAAVIRLMGSGSLFLAALIAAGLLFLVWRKTRH